jgi:hypothetical protein
MSKKLPFNFIRKTQSTFGSGNTVAGGDINYNYIPQQNETMKALIAAYRKEQSEDATFNSIIEELDFYLKPVKSEVTQIIGVEKKLKDGQYDHLVDFALAAKDIFVKKVERHRLSKTVQKIFVYILGDIWRLYNLQIYPFILSNVDQKEIMKKINEEIIDKISQKLEDNVLDIFNDCILGMIYFLTGNCHIKWSKS